MRLGFGWELILVFVSVMWLGGGCGEVVEKLC